MRVTQKSFITGLLTGGVAVIALAGAATLLVMKLGLIAVNADQSPPAWEARLLGMAVHASVARHAQAPANPIPPTEENLLAGAEIYTQMCARCHGQANSSRSALGSSFYPPAPSLPGRPARYTEAELFWIVKHGIRNTSMPAWGSLLSDQDIWQVVAFVKRIDALPPAVEVEWKKARCGAANQ